MQGFHRHWGKIYNRVLDFLHSFCCNLPELRTFSWKHKPSDLTWDYWDNHIQK